ncbi:MAG: family 78 glycoside hydrolase catalytic domain [Leeuwenhoekiella sp.]
MKVSALFLLMLLVFASCKNDPDTLNIADLKTEYLSNLIGLDTQNPRFTWSIESKIDSIRQKSFHVFVGKDSAEVAKKQGNIWDETKESDSILIKYQGKPLEPFTKYFWGVEVTDNYGNISDFQVSSFETGMMKMTNWKGSWITDVEDQDLKPAPYFRKVIQTEKKVVKATAYLAAAGLFEFYINGNKVGDHQLDPMYTRFDKRNLYVTFDVTDKFKEGEVALGVLLGNGWYNHQSTAVWEFDKAGWRNRPRFSLNLKVNYEDGSSETFVTDNSWKTDLSPVVFNSIYTAEHVDNRLAQPDWDMPDFDDSDWKNAIEMPAPSDNIVAQAMHPIRITEEIIPVNMRKISDTSYIFDLGRNISGITKLKVKGEKGTVLRVIHSEQLDTLQNLDLSNIILHYRPHDDKDPFQTDIYTLNGEGEETFMPKFNYKGFQYVEVESSKPIDLTKESVTGEFMHSDVPSVGSIHTSNEIINKIWEATNASYLSNLFGYPTDCPQREKNGWTGDAHINTETGLYNFDAITIYEKWMADHRDEQQPNGVLPSIIPTWGWGYDWGNGPDWTSTIAIIPWELYQFYGDDKALQANYDNIKKYVDHITSISHENGLTDWGLGDWVPVKSVTPKEYTSSIYYFVDATILAKTAQHLDKQSDYKTYSALAQNIKKAINAKYLNTETAIYGEGFQTELSAALYWDVVPEDLREKVAENLANRVISDGKHIDVGLLGTKTILGALSSNGYADLAYEVASQETYPSWGWWIKNGATTLYENWDINATADISKNHIMFGAIGAWLYKGLGGILPDENSPGFKNVMLKPNFVAGLDSFEAKHKGPFGEIISTWTKEDDHINYQVTIPPNSTATLEIYKAESVRYNDKEIISNRDDNFIINLASGEHSFQIKKK